MTDRLNLVGAGGRGTTSPPPPPSGTAPVITSANVATFTFNTPATFTVTATGSPAPSFTETGSLPSGVTFAGGVLGGTPTGSGVYAISITAANGVAPNATQSFSLTVTWGGFILPAQTITGTMTGPSSAAADFTGDGRPDVVWCRGTTICDLFVNNGSGGFNTVQTFAAGVGGSAFCVASGDLDLDGKADLVIGTGSSAQPAIAVLIGNGNGTFKTAVTYSTSNGADAYSSDNVVLADLNNDGKLDIVCYSYTNNTTPLYTFINNGDGTFAAAQFFATINGPGASVFCICAFISGHSVYTDVAKVDIFGVKVLFGVGDGTFIGGPDLVPANACTGIVAGSLRGNGINDIVAVELTAVNVFLGNGNGTFKPVVTYSTTVTSATTAVLADITGDGILDIVVRSSGQLAMLQGNGDGTFKAAQTFTMTGNLAQIIKADINGDGRQDIIGGNSNKLAWLLNQ